MSSFEVINADILYVEEEFIIDKTAIIMEWITLISISILLLPIPYA